MSTWWGSLSFLQQCFALFALPATLILVIQTVLLLFGLAGESDGSGDHEIAHDGHGHEQEHHVDDGLRIFTVRGFVAFFTIFGWVGIVLTETSIPFGVNLLLSVIAGFITMFIIAYFFKMAMGLQSSGNLDMRNSLGKTGTVYIPIPPERAGKGKVTMVVQGRFTEIDAVTDHNETLKTGMEVVGISISNQNVLCVVPKGK